MNDTPVPPAPAMFPYADVSTILVDDADLMLLTNVPIEGNSLFVAEYPEGVFIHLSKDDSDFVANELDFARSLGLSEKFCQLLTTVRAWGFMYLRLDSDGLVVDPIEPPKTKEEVQRAKGIADLVDWSRGYIKKAPFGDYRSEFKELAGYVELLRDGALSDGDWPRVNELIAEAGKID